MSKTHGNGGKANVQRQILDRCRFVNAQRLQRIHRGLSGKQRLFFDALPPLFHYNHPALPGFISDETPANICAFRPSKRHINGLRAIAPSFEFQQGPPSPLRAEILGVFFMGSAGSIAHSDASDFDIWLCIDPVIHPQRRRRLQHKIALINERACALGLELHFYIIDPKRFRAGENYDLSIDSVDCSQHHLLLDEFYRSHVLMAGLYPVWWLVPPAHDGNYGHYVQHLIATGSINADDYIDLGPLTQIPQEEFFGAAMWQLFQSLYSPYKSLLKLVLAEAYANDHPTPNLVSRQLKSLVYRGHIDIDALDPYVLVFRRVEQYLNRQKDTQRLELLRRYLYCKAGTRLSQPASNRPAEQWCRNLIEKLAKTWGWSHQDISKLDALGDVDNAVGMQQQELSAIMKRCFLIWSQLAEQAGYPLSAELPQAVRPVRHREAAFVSSVQMLSH